MMMGCNALLFGRGWLPFSNAKSDPTNPLLNAARAVPANVPEYRYIAFSGMSSPLFRDSFTLHHAFHR
jgi:hypothetical protein